MCVYVCICAYMCDHTCKSEWQAYGQKNLSLGKNTPARVNSLVLKTLAYQATMKSKSTMSNHYLHVLESNYVKCCVPYEKKSPRDDKYTQLDPFGLCSFL